MQCFLRSQCHTSEKWFIFFNFPVRFRSDSREDNRRRRDNRRDRSENSRSPPPEKRRRSDSGEDRKKIKVGLLKLYLLIIILYSCKRDSAVKCI